MGLDATAGTPGRCQDPSATARGPRPLVLSGLDRLPHDVLLRIFSSCNGDDVRALSEVNTRFCEAARDNHLWRILYTKRTGNAPTDQTRPCRDQYDEQDQLVLSVARDCDIEQNHPPHWTNLVHPRGAFGQVAMLNAISSLYVRGRLDGVHTGTYRVVWRLAIAPLAENLFGITFSAKTSIGHVSESRLPFDANLVTFGSDFFDFALPQTLEVTAPFDDVVLECKETSSRWKTNIIFCSARLEPISRRPYTQRYRWSGHRAVLGGGGCGPGTSGRNAVAASPPPPGASYRLWKPWRPADRRETVCMAVFVAIFAYCFACLLIDRAT